MKILLAMDTSATSQAALEEAALRPWPANSSFDVISVVEPPHLWTTSEAAQQAESCARELVEGAVEWLKGANIEATGAVLSGDPKTAILDRARTDGADLVMVGSHGTGVTPFLLGNVAADIVRHAPCPVEVVRKRTCLVGGIKILLATDGSEYSDRAARSISERPWPAGSEVEVMSVVELALTPGRALFEVPMIDTEFLESARAEAMKRAQDAITRAREILANTGLRVTEATSVLAEVPRTVILNEALDWGADLIVLGSHGREGFDRFLAGSVSEGVATHAGCSVEVIRKAA